MYQASRGRDAVVVWLMGVVLGVGGRVESVGDYCPDCVDTSSVTCRPWGQGQAWLRWASLEEPGSDITLTAGPCGEAGETARGYVFACMDVHDAVCAGGTPCGGDAANHGTFAILRVSGDPTAFRHIFPDGLSITSDQIVGLYPEVNYAYIAVDKAGCDYRIGLAGPPQMRLRLEATVAQCLSDFDNSTFGITVTFYQQRSQNPERYSLLARARGSITVKANKRTSHDPIAFTPDLRDGSSIAWIETVQRVYASGGEDCWTIPCRQAYQNGQEVYCSRVDAWLGPVNIPDTSRYLVPNSATYTRVKYPSYRKDVYATPAYAAMDGWSYNLNDRYIALDLGDQGTLYYHCDKKLDETRYAVSSIERCGPGVPAGEGQTEWLLRYDGDRLAYIYNTAEPVGDPNSPQGTRCYVYDWTGEVVEVTYQSRPDLVSPWSAVRQWELEFDAEGRAIKYDAGCLGGCGSSGGDFEHVEYDPDFEDLIVKRSDAQGRTVLLNTYAQVIYGPYVPACPVGIGNAGFESDAVDEGTCRQDLLPAAWTLAYGEQASIWVCDDANSAPEGAQFLHLNGAVALEQITAEGAQEQMGYTLRAAVRALPGQTGQTAGISLFASSDTAREYPLLALIYDAVGDPDAGQWKALEATWESGPYEPVDENERMIVEVTGNLVQIDDVRLEVAARLYNRSRPVLVKQEAADLANPEGLVTVAEWTYPQDDNGRTVVEKRRVDETHWAVTEYEYDDSSLSRLAGKTEYTALQTTPTAPTGTSYTTIYDPNDVHGTSVTVYPNNFEPGFEGGKRADVRRYDTAGNLIESYVVDRVTDVNSLLEQYTYVHYTGGSEDQWLVEEQTNPRGGVTEHSYRLYGSGSTMTPRHLLESRIGPATEAGSQEVWYNYDGAMRLISERRKDTLGRWVTTGYTYDPETGFLEAVIQHGEGVHARTEYKHNDFGQVVRQIDPDGVVTGKAYGQGGELVSEFVLAEGADPNAPDEGLMLVSQTRYEYDEDGRLETVTRALDEGSFLYDYPDDWVATRYEYDSRGRKRAVIEDWDEAGQRANLRTSYEYDEQGRLRQTTYPTGRWVRTTRDGRGLVTLEEVGYGEDPAEVVVYTTGYEYDANGNLIEQVNPDGTVLVHRYDNFDRLRKTYQYSTSGPWTYREYDAAGAVVLEQAFEADGMPLQDRRKVYDVAGQPTLERTTASPGALADANDLITTYGYDVAGHVRWVIAKGVGSSDPNGMIEPNDVVTEHRYDALGRKIATIDPEGIWTTFAYSPGGRLLTVVDPNIPDPNQIFVTVHAYDAAGRPARTTTPEGDYTLTFYNSLDQVIREVVWDCNSTVDYTPDDVPVRQVRYAYDRLGSRTREAVMKDPASAAAVDVTVDQVTDWVYDPDTGLLEEIRTYYNAEGTPAITRLYYDGIGRNWRTVDPEGNETQEFYDPVNGVQVVKRQQIERDPAEPGDDYTMTVFYDYDDYGNLWTRTLDEDGDGQEGGADPTTTYNYDGLGRLTVRTGPDDVATRYEYDGFGNVSRTIEDDDPQDPQALNRTTEAVFDRLNRQIRAIAYDPNDTTAHVARQVTDYAYNKRGQVSRITHPDETFTQYYYNTLRRVDEEVRRDGTSVYYWYDLVGHVVVESDDEDPEYGSPTFVTEYAFNAAGDLTWCRKEDDGGLTAESTFLYNGLGLVESETTSLYDLGPKTTTYTYDGSGNRLTQTHGGQTLTFTYDGLGRIKTIDRGADEIVTYAYIGAGTKAIDYPEAQTTWQAGYDALGRLERCTAIDPNDETLLDLIYTHDENGNRDSVEYNHLAVPVWDIYTYDAVQRLTHAEYGSASGLAKLEDLAGDVGFAAAVGAQWLSSDEAFIDLARQRVRELRRRQKGLYRALAEAGLDGLPAEDDGGRLPVLALVDFGTDEPVEDDQALTYEMIRDDTGEVIAIVIADGQGRVTLLTMYPAIGGTVVVSIRYDEQGQAVAKLCSTYDEQGNLVDVVDLLATESTEVHRAQTLVSSEPSVASVAETSLDGGMMTMSAPTAPPAATEAFVYDHLGNRVTYTDKEGYPTTYAHNGLNQYTHVHRDLVWDLEEDYYPEHDANGNLSRDRHGYVYSYDYRNRLTQIAGELAFGYDALGRRVKKTDDDAGATTYFYYDPFGRVIAEYEKPDGGSAALARVFVYGNGIDEVLAMFTPYHAGDPGDWQEFLDFCGVWLLDSGDPGYDDAFDVVDDNVIDLKDFAVLAASWDLPSSEESDWYYLHDALGSVVGVVGARFGRESDREFFLYYAYGQPDVLPANGNPYLFTGRRHDLIDDDQILYYLRARHYSPLTGRFLQTDPIGYADSMNLYEYVLSNPANYVDPYGLQSLFEEQFSWWDRFRYEHGMVGGWPKLSPEEASRMEKYWEQYHRAVAQNQHPDRTKEYCQAAKEVANGCKDKAVEGYCRYILFVDEHGYRGVYDRIVKYAADPYTNRILMCYEYNGQDLEQAIDDACNWRMVGADLAGLTGLCYGLDYLKGEASVDINTGRVFSGEEQYVQGLTGLSQFCGTTAAGAKLVMACGKTAAAAASKLGNTPNVGQNAASITTPYAVETQGTTAAARDALARAQRGATLYRAGELGKSMAAESQYWSLHNPLSPGYATQMGMPSVAPNFMMGGSLSPGASVLTNTAPGLGVNAGGGIQVVTSPSSVGIQWFVMP